MIDRRTFLFQGAAAIATSSYAAKHEKVNSVYEGIPIGVITYSYRTMPVGRFKTIEYVKASGLSEMEITSSDLELDAGAPVQKRPAQMSKKEKWLISEWRKKVDIKRFEEVRDRYKAAGINTHIVKFSSIGNLMAYGDDYIEYCFKAAKALGVSAITREIPDPKKLKEWEPKGRRLARFAEKYDIPIAFHNHLQINMKTYDGPLLDWSPKFMINFDIGHYIASNKDDPLAFVKKYHDRIASVHLKDRTRNASGRKNLPFGKGDTPLKGLFNLMKKEGYRFPCDIELEYPIPDGSNAVNEVNISRKYCQNAIIA